MTTQATTFWTYKQFDWALNGRVNLDLIRKDDYVTQMWSEKYFMSMKDGMGLLKQSAKDCLRSAVQCQVLDAGKHLLNLLIVLAMMGVNIELGNFIKGLAGALIAGGKIVCQPVIVVVHLVAAFIYLCMGKRMEMQEQLQKAKENAVGFVKNIVSLITCVGHAIPSWVPLVLLFICPPVGVAFGVIKVLAEYTGIFDVLAYGGTALMLRVKSWVAADDATARAAQEAWARLKHELNPFISFEGATLAIYACHVVVEGLSTIADIIFPGAGTAIKLGSYALQGAVGIGLYGNIGRQAYAEHKREQLRQGRQGGNVQFVPNGTLQLRLDDDGAEGQLLLRSPPQLVTPPRETQVERVEIVLRSPGSLRSAGSGTSAISVLSL